MITRRTFLRRGLAASGGVAASGLIPATLFVRSAGAGAPALVTSASMRPAITHGIASGDVTGGPAGGGAVIWSRCDRPARLIVEYTTSPSFGDANRLAGPVARPDTDFTARLELSGLPPDQELFYRVFFEDNSSPRTLSAPVAGRFRTAPSAKRDILFAWSGDQVGAGWGINPEWGGLKIFEQIRKLNPDFFIHSGDRIYADQPLQPEVSAPMAGNIDYVWKNLVTPEKSKVAETLDEYRGNYKYNLLDEHYLRFNAEVPMCVQWDDHEVRNNWYPGQVIDDRRYTVNEVDVLAARGRRAFFEYSPIRVTAEEPGRIYRSFSYGPSVDVFMLDCRSYRGPNSGNQQPRPGPDTAFLGKAQVGWLKRGLAASKATWKVVASDMPIGIRQRPRGLSEAWANMDHGAPRGRELELADLLRFIKRNRIRNLVWLTAQVHYASANYYDPARAGFTDFEGFWEFVAGPLHTLTGSGCMTDNTFGIDIKFTTCDGVVHPPSDGRLNFGTVGIDGKTEVMTVKFIDLAGKTLFSIDLDPRF